MITKLYTTAKNGWSAANHGLAWLLGKAQTCKLPPYTLISQLVGRLIPTVEPGRYYTGDPLNGAGDFGLHPERFEWGIQTGRYRELHIDCDDYASYYFLALRSMKDYRPMILTVRDAGIKWSHVICVYEHNGKYGMLDTNGHRSLPDLTDATIITALKGLYPEGAYCEVVDSGYAF